ncbi:MAG: coiled-coil domain-containing protein [Promethearchaeota archaeon]
MSINWSFKPKDLKRTIDDLEKKIKIKYVENKQKKEEINILLSKLENNSDNIRDIESKLEYAEGEINVLNDKLEKLNSEILILQREISDLNKDILIKKGKITELRSIKTNLEEKHFLKVGLNNLKSDKLIKLIKEILFQKGFLSQKEFEDLTQKI